MIHNKTILPEDITLLHSFEQVLTQTTLPSLTGSRVLLMTKSRKSIGSFIARPHFKRNPLLFEVCPTVDSLLSFPDLKIFCSNPEAGGIDWEKIGQILLKTVDQSQMLTVIKEKV